MAWATAVKKASAEYNREKKPARKVAAKKRTPAKKVSGVGKVKPAKKVTIKAKVVKISGVAGMGAVNYNRCVGEIQRVTVMIDDRKKKMRLIPPSQRKPLMRELKQLNDYKAHLNRERTGIKKFL